MDRRVFCSSALATLAIPKKWDQKKENQMRDAFPISEHTVYLNSAGMMPLSSFSRAGMERYLEFQAHGFRNENVSYVRQVQNDSKSFFANLIGAEADEIAWVPCTKAGEWQVLDSIDEIKSHGNVVTNDLHFNGSLHHLMGLKSAGRDIRLVKAREWKVPVEEMVEAIDAKTAVVAITLVSNVNGHIEDIKTISAAAHKVGALVYADVIQAAGIYPFDVRELGVDAAACSTYKWLYGTYGAGFFYVKKAWQDRVQKDRRFPGRISYNYEPWQNKTDSKLPDMIVKNPMNASRYEPGHMNYLGLCAAYEGLKFIREMGVKNLLDHTIQLILYFVEKLNRKDVKVISPHLGRSQILTLWFDDPTELEKRLPEAPFQVSYHQHQMRISPAIFNTKEDMLQLVEFINGLN